MTPRQLCFLLLLSQSCTAQTRLYSHGLRTGKNIALTFDACSTTRRPGYDSAIIHILRELRCPATLFLSGRWIQRYPTVTRALAKDSLFELGTHGFSHKLLTSLPRDSVVGEIQLARSALKKVTGLQSRLFRAPYGAVDSIVLRIVDSLGLTTIQYDVASGDPDTTFTKERLVMWVTSAARSGSVVVFHMNGRGWHTAEALPEIVGILREKGLRLVRMSELLRRE